MVQARGGYWRSNETPDWDLNVHTYCSLDFIPHSHSRFFLWLRTHACPGPTSSSWEVWGVCANLGESLAATHACPGPTSSSWEVWGVCANLRDSLAATPRPHGPTSSSWAVRGVCADRGMSLITIPGLEGPSTSSWAESTPHGAEGVCVNREVSPVPSPGLTRPDSSSKGATKGACTAAFITSSPRQGPDIVIAGVDPSAGGQAHGTIAPRHIEEEPNIMTAGVDPSAGGYARTATLPSSCGSGSCSLTHIGHSCPKLEIAEQQPSRRTDVRKQEVPATGLCFDYSLVLVLMLTHPKKARRYLLHNKGQMGQPAWGHTGAPYTQPETVLSFIRRTPDSMIIRALRAGSTELSRLSRVLDQLLLFTRMRLLSEHARLSGRCEIDMWATHHRPTHAQLTQRKYKPATVLMQALMIRHLRLDLWVTHLTGNDMSQLHAAGRHPGVCACGGTTGQSLLTVHMTVEINHSADTPVVGHCWPFVNRTMGARRRNRQDGRIPRQSSEVTKQTQGENVATLPALGGRQNDSPRLEIERKFSLAPTRFEELSRSMTEALSEQHQDLYFDTRTYQLSQRDWWLRLRDNHWDLKIPAHRGADEGTSTSTQFWELEEEDLICRQLGILALPNQQRRLEAVEEAAFGTRLVDTADEGLQADFATTGGTRHLFFHLCANMETRRLSVVSPSDDRVTMALDAVTFHPLLANDRQVGSAPDFHICELEIMLKNGKPETRRLAEIALEREAQRLRLSTPGQSKLFTYLRQYSPMQFNIWRLRHNQQELRPLLVEAGLRRTPGQDSSRFSQSAPTPRATPGWLLCRICKSHESVIRCHECQRPHCEAHHYEGLCPDCDPEHRSRFTATTRRAPPSMEALTSGAARLGPTARQRRGHSSSTMGDGPATNHPSRIVSTCCSSHLRHCELRVHRCATCPRHACDFCAQDGHCPHCIQGRRFVALLVLDVHDGFSLMTGRDDTQEWTLQVPLTLVRANESLGRAAARALRQTMHHEIQDQERLRVAAPDHLISIKRPPLDQQHRVTVLTTAYGNVRPITRTGFLQALATTRLRDFTHLLQQQQEGKELIADAVQWALEHMLELASVVRSTLSTTEGGTMPRDGLTWATATACRGMSTEEKQIQEQHECCYQQLKEWPYPTPDEVRSQAQLTQRTPSQVASWFQWRRDHDVHRCLHWPRVPWVANPPTHPRPGSLAADPSAGRAANTWHVTRQLMTISRAESHQRWFRRMQQRRSMTALRGPQSESRGGNDISEADGTGERRWHFGLQDRRLFSVRCSIRKARSQGLPRVLPQATPPEASSLSQPDTCPGEEAWLRQRALSQLQHSHQTFGTTLRRVHLEQQFSQLALQTPSAPSDSPVAARNISPFASCHNARMLAQFEAVTHTTSEHPASYALCTRPAAASGTTPAELRALRRTQVPFAQGRADPMEHNPPDTQAQGGTDHLTRAPTAHPPTSRNSTPVEESLEPMGVLACASLGEEQTDMLTQPFALEQFQDVGILEQEDCDIRVDPIEASECEIFLKAILRDDGDKSDDEQPMHCAGVAVFASMSEYEKETRWEEHTLQHHRDQDRIPQACFEHPVGQRCHGQGRAWLDAVSLLGQSGVQYSTLLAANNRAQMKAILDMGAEYPIIRGNCVTLEQWEEAWPCTSRTMGIGGLRRYRHCVPVEVHHPHGLWTLRFPAMVASDNRITRDCELLLDLITIITLIQNFNFDDVTNPVHTFRSLSRLIRAVDAFATYEPAPQRGRFKQRLMSVISPQGNYTPDVRQVKP